MRYASCILLSFLPFLLQAQYAPKAGRAGSTAIHKDSSAIVAWAGNCQLNRGWKDISMPDSGKATLGEAANAEGKADGSVVSLGDGGMVLLTFNPPVVNGPGADFAVFENGFPISAANDSDFLELAFVEVSSDGIHFFRFPSVSTNDTLHQLNNSEGMRATSIHNFAGKYTNGYGTPFDLDELPGDALLDPDHITHIRLIDVVGSLNDSFATRDSKGNKVNDPWPTPFAQSGFDLDAIAVIHNVDFPNNTTTVSRTDLQLFPNPVKAGEKIVLSGTENIIKVRITGSDGKTWLFDGPEIDTRAFFPGLYYLFVETEQGTRKKSLLIL